MEVVISGASVDYRHYIYAGSEPIAVYSRKSSGVNAFSYFLADHQSSVAKVVNASTNAVAVSESFTPFGNRRDPSSWSGTASTSDLTTSAGISRQGYTFQTQLGLWMGLNHMNGRVQDAITGRFLSPDHSVQDEQNPQDYNNYTYALNNPLTYTDPTGFEFCNEDECPPLTPDMAEVDVSATFGGGWGSQIPGDVPPSNCSSFGCLTYTQVCSGGSCVTNPYFYPADPSLALGSIGLVSPGSIGVGGSSTGGGGTDTGTSMQPSSPTQSSQGEQNQLPEKKPEESCGPAATYSLGAAGNIGALGGLQLDFRIGFTTSLQFFASGSFGRTVGAQVGAAASVFEGVGTRLNAFPRGLSTGVNLIGGFQGVAGIGGGFQTEINLNDLQDSSYGGDFETRLSAGEYVSWGAVGTSNSATYASPPLLCLHH
jgi:RHS repeat-associated protein